MARWMRLTLIDHDSEHFARPELRPEFLKAAARRQGTFVLCRRAAVSPIEFRKISRVSATPWRNGLGRGGPGCMVHADPASVS